MFWRLQARVLIFNRLRGSGLKATSAQSLGKSHQNGEYRT